MQSPPSHPIQTLLQNIGLRAPDSLTVDNASIVKRPKAHRILKARNKEFATRLPMFPLNWKGGKE